MIFQLLLLLLPIITLGDSKVGFFLRNPDLDSTVHTALNSPALEWLTGFTHYRLIPGLFPKGMEYHFDGLATVLKVTISDKEVATEMVPYKSKLFEHYNRCIFLGSGTGPTLGIEPCTSNPVVNLLPIEDQLWLTIDNVFWGRIDPETLDTIKANISPYPALTLNAHPACDTSTNQCFVQHPCGVNPETADVCVSVLKTTETNDLMAEQVGKTSMDKAKFMQHSHSPCVTPNYVVSKLDSFGRRNTPAPKGSGGILNELHQVLGNDWVVYNRNTNETKVMKSDVSFVNNHFWNCYESDPGVIVIETVPATDQYLDSYFTTMIERPTNWTNIFQVPQRCFATLAIGEIFCQNLLQDPTIIFDYPTFNPLYKMNPDYQYTYGISPISTDSLWFDRLVKLNMKTGLIEKEWSEPNIFPTEADFIVRSDQAEDDGLLISVLYNKTADKSSVGLFDATDLSLVELIDLQTVIPFHAHGINCYGGKCYSNP